MHTRNSLVSLTENHLLYISKTNIGSDFNASFHSHPNLEILLITEGKGKIALTKKNLSIQKGDIIIINKNSNHCEITNDNLTFYAIGVNNTDAFLENTFSKKILYMHLDSNEFHIALSLYDLIFLESILNHQTNIISHLYQSVLDLIKRNSTIYFDHAQTKSYSDTIHTAINIIDNYYYTDLKLSQIASRLSLSVSSLCHLFKKETKMTIGEYIALKQCMEAKTLLETTDMSMIDIASAVGFNNASYFTKVFKSRFNKTPKDYRNQYRKRIKQ